MPTSVQKMAPIGKQFSLAFVILISFFVLATSDEFANPPNETQTSSVLISSTNGPRRTPKRNPIIYVDIYEYLSKHMKNCNKAYNGDRHCNISKVVTDRSLQWITDTGKPADDAEEREQAQKPNLRAAAVQGNLMEKNDTYLEKRFLGIPFKETGSTTLIWGMRQAHGALMSLIMFCVMPIHLFMTRYMKESFMNKRILYSRVWYQVHLHGVLITLVLMIASLVTAVFSRGFLGVSLTTSGVVHRCLGWVTAVLFVFLTIFGGFRGFQDPLRKITIFAHWFLGTLFYVLMVVLMLTAAYIPGSGISSWDSSYHRVYKGTGSVAWSGSVIHMIIWIIFEVIMHILMTLNMIIFDRKMQITDKRMYLPVPIPVIREHSSRNAEGHGVRLISLIVYVHYCLLNTLIYYIVSIHNTPWEGKGLGPMSCSHDETTWMLLENVSKADHFSSCIW